MPELEEEDKPHGRRFTLPHFFPIRTTQQHNTDRPNPSNPAAPGANVIVDGPLKHSYPIRVKFARDAQGKDPVKEGWVGRSGESGEFTSKGTGGGEAAGASAKWADEHKESEHKRDEEGKFTETGGGVAGLPTTVPAKVAAALGDYGFKHEYSTPSGLSRLKHANKAEVVFNEDGGYWTVYAPYQMPGRPSSYSGSARNVAKLRQALEEVTKGEAAKVAQKREIEAKQLRTERGFSTKQYNQLLTKRPPANAAQQTAIRTYTDPGKRGARSYARWNNALRSSKGEDSGDYDAQTSALTDWLKSASLPEPITVKRALVGDFAQHLMAQMTKRGTVEFTDHGFSSADGLFFESEQFGVMEKPLMLEIKLPKGAQAAAVGDYSAMGSKEREILIQRGSRFRVVSYNKETRTMQAECLKCAR